jgi:polar amino acid transport system substrate-binding protein
MLPEISHPDRIDLSTLAATARRRAMLASTLLVLTGCTARGMAPSRTASPPPAPPPPPPPEPVSPPNPETTVLRELAPSGRLRAAIAVGPSSSTFRGTLDAAGGQPRGVATDLASALGARLRLPVVLIPFGSFADLLEAGARGAWDVTFLPYDDAGTRLIDYGPSYFDQSYTYLVRARVPIARVTDLDRKGIRLAVTEGSVAARNREAAIKAATIVRFRTLNQIREQLRTGTVDAAGAGRETLVGLAAQVPGSKVLDDAFFVERVAIGVPKGRATALRVAAAFMEDAKRDGTVRRAFDAAGFKDAVVAAPSTR